jgi:tRNA:m4X modification enzyme
VAARTGELSLSQKHSPQHAALLSLALAAWPSAEKHRQVAVMELGAGKGGLALALHQKLVNGTETHKTSFFVVDVGGFRRKKDGCVRDEAMPFCRLRINIKDLDLRRVAELQTTLAPPNDEGPAKVGVVGIGKHLCGACADFALSCLVNDSPENMQVAAVVIATCCHHLCRLEHLNRLASSPASESFLGHFTAAEFAAIASLTSWCVSGSAVDDGQRALGRRCKRLIDYARVLFLRQTAGFVCVELVDYVDEGISPENVCIFARRGN